MLKNHSIILILTKSGKIIHVLNILEIRQLLEFNLMKCKKMIKYIYIYILIVE